MDGHRKFRNARRRYIERRLLSRLRVLGGQSGASSLREVHHHIRSRVPETLNDGRRPRAQPEPHRCEHVRRRSRTQNREKICRPRRARNADYRYCEIQSSRKDLNGRAQPGKLRWNRGGKLRVAVPGWTARKLKFNPSVLLCGCNTAGFDDCSSTPAIAAALRLPCK
jgi:hypothetical protein